MGSTCVNGSEHVTSRQSIQQNIFKRCVISQKSKEIIIELMNGDIEAVPYCDQIENIVFRNFVHPGLYFTDDNRVCYAQQFFDEQEKGFMELVHAYYLLIKMKPENILEVDKAYCFQKHKGFMFMIKSKPLGPNNFSYVDLVDLGRKMKDKKICWQDTEFEEIIQQTCRRINKLQASDLSGITNVIMGSDGSIHLIGKLSLSPTLAKREYIHMKQLFLDSLFGTAVLSQKQVQQFEGKSQFKHPNSLSAIGNLKKVIEQESAAQYQGLKNPHLKFIRDYIQAYFYKFSMQSFEIVEIYITLRQYQQAKKLLIAYIDDEKLYDDVSAESLKTYKMLLEIQENIDDKSEDCCAIKDKLASLSYSLGISCLNSSRFIEAHSYFISAKQICYSKPIEDLFLKIIETSFALGMNKIGEITIAEGIEQYPNNKCFFLVSIVYLCDCLRLEEAQKCILKATKTFTALEHSICEAKILLTRGLLNSVQKHNYLSKAEGNLANVNLSEFENEELNQTMFALPYYFEIYGDVCLNKKNYDRARENYHNAAIFIKRLQDGIQYRLAVLTAAQANCYHLTQRYENAMEKYSEAAQCVNKDCRVLWHSILGNKAINKIKLGFKEEGLKDIYKILDEVSAESLLHDYNYIFLSNVARRQSRIDS